MMRQSSWWVRISLINLGLVAVLGSIMRYKIGFELPFFEQKFLQEAHSHFAFTGWISHTLYFLLYGIFKENLPDVRDNVYRKLILINLLSAYGLLVSFLVQGYGPVSLFFSTISMINGYVFAGFALRDTARLPSTHLGKNWITVSLWFSILSTVGTMVLSWMMSTHHFDKDVYLGSIYFYLHFQYNGWFIFACFGIFMDRIKTLHPPVPEAKRSFLLFALAGIPAYFLSTLWAHLPVWLYALVVVAAIIQVAGWYYFVRMLIKVKTGLSQTFERTVLVLFVIVGLALSLKLILQLGSTIPIVSKLAFGFRPIVIAYLHLVLLLIVTGFLLTFLFGTGIIRPTRQARFALVLFIGGVILNELVLAIQGIGAFSYTVIPYANEALFGIALILLSGTVLLLLSQWKQRTGD